jgi:hypothetical protein
MCFVIIGTENDNKSSTSKKNKMKTAKIGNKIRKTVLFMTILMAGLFSLPCNAICSDPDISNTGSDAGSNAVNAEKILAGLSKIELAEISLPVTEEETQLEKWMIDIKDNSWQQDQEEEMPLEKWMFDSEDKTWYATDNEEEIVVEGWMLDSSDWIN